MKRQITVSQYRTVDLTILAVILAVIQILIHFAASLWFRDQLYVVSPVAVVVALVMMRWNGYGAVHAVLGGILYSILAGGTWQHTLIYGIGNLFALLALVLFAIIGKEKVRQNVIYSLLFAFCTQGLMLLGRAVVAKILGFSWDACLGFITTDILSVLLTLCGVWAVRRMDGLFEDQIQYLLRIQQEQNVEGGEQL